MAMAHTVKHLGVWLRSGFEDGPVALDECRRGRPEGVTALAGALVHEDPVRGLHVPSLWGGSAVFFGLFGFAARGLAECQDVGF
jgi:hypothetical protein